MTLLTIAQDAAVMLSLQPPAAVVGSTDKTARLLLQLANLAGREIARRHDWQAITVERTFTSLATVEQTGFIPADFDRFVYMAEVWDRTRNFKFSGPTPSRAWQELQSGLSSGVVGWWRLLGGELNIFPAQDAGNTLSTEYVSKYWAESSIGTAQEKFEEDTDVALIPEDLIMLNILWRYGAVTKSFDYSENMATFEREFSMRAARDRGLAPIYPPPQESQLPAVPTWPGTITVP